MSTAFITGASSGIGLALAQELARRGWRVALAARRSDLIDAAAAQIGDRAMAVTCDVTDAQSVRDAVAAAVAAFGPIDLAIANAGVGLPSHAARFNLPDAELMIRTNVLGMMYLFDATVPAMVERGSGRFAGVASLAGLRGLPATSVYSASKAAMQAFLEASRVDLAPLGVAVTTINPGFVVTPMTEKNKFRMPALMKVETAARVIANGLERGQREVEFPRRMSWLMRFTRLVPNAVYDRVTRPYSGRKMDEAKMKR
jgi:NADP-dependent 3-hydroxy acid dehydrogenase YdfG